jgi:hypothetical protein
MLLRLPNTGQTEKGRRRQHRPPTVLNGLDSYSRFPLAWQSVAVPVVPADRQASLTVFSVAWHGFRLSRPCLTSRSGSLVSAASGGQSQSPPSIRKWVSELVSGQLNWAGLDGPNDPTNLT